AREETDTVQIDWSHCGNSLFASTRLVPARQRPHRDAMTQPDLHMTTHDHAGTVARSREIERQVKGHRTSDGAGVRLTRVLTQDLQRRLDPFLMLDAFRSDDPDDYIAGFPDHPHRGFETITYMLAGRIRHRDSGGNEGMVSAGGVQWMTAARGVVH